MSAGCCFMSRAPAAVGSGKGEPIQTESQTWEREGKGEKESES